jgi:MerR family regulatory protein
MNVDKLTIGQLSKQAGVKVVTIRYYEGLKLMPAPPRTQANYRYMTGSNWAGFDSFGGAVIWASHLTKSESS